MAEADYKTWFSTYGLLTANRILDRFKIHLSHDDLVRALKQEDNVYYPLIRVPLKNIFNGIVLEQAYDYQVYLQKLFIDYRLSDEYAKAPDSPGQSIRNDLNDIFNEVSKVIKDFSELRLNHLKLISESQAWLISLVRQRKTVGKQIFEFLTDPGFIENSQQFIHRTEEEAVLLKNYRSQYQGFILKTTELINLLPDYRIEAESEEENRETLFFDPTIGDYGELS